MLWFLACTPPADDTKTPADETDADTDTDADIDADTVVGETDAVMASSFTLDASGVGTQRLGAVELLDQAGTLVLNGVTHIAVAYQDHDWAETGYHLYDLLSIAEDGSNLAVTYLYCQDEGMPYIYVESFVDALGFEPASGSCTGEATSGETAVSLPALRARPEPFDAGFVIEGDFVYLDGAIGDITLGPTSRTILPFDTVDCSDCPGGPWYEIHALLEGDDDACFGILYLYPEEPTVVDLSYTLCLPTLERPDAGLEATWSGSPSGPPSGPPVPWRPRPW